MFMSPTMSLKRGTDVNENNKVEEGKQNVTEVQESRFSSLNLVKCRSKDLKGN